MSRRVRDLLQVLERNGMTQETADVEITRAIKMEKLLNKHAPTEPVSDAKAKEHYDKSIAVSPNYFGTKVILAQYYAIKKQDKALFKDLAGPWLLRLGYEPGDDW